MDGGGCGGGVETQKLKCHGSAWRLVEEEAEGEVEGKEEEKRKWGECSNGGGVGEENSLRRSVSEARAATRSAKGG